MNIKTLAKNLYNLVSILLKSFINRTYLKTKNNMILGKNIIIKASIK
ncbi:hypothetical protein LY01_00493 [Nonlabens xylanidelens]|uniref:Uncharacterized protein n=1 Tax=Nonlabens xylanidelens TaxID=191564 RepID=A0A2S6IRA1_9FLAO|nr:hypothetical protein [Nonlabens xylanidelens]PPK96670.1 hypothetical protein LY01_00493 [Nonlabens xylanidelens]